MSDSNELGKISKPKASNFMGKRNLLIVQLLPYIQDAPREYHDLCDRYWEAIDNQVSTMEERLGVVKRIFCDGLPGKGEDVKVALEKANPARRGSLPHGPMVVPLLGRLRTPRCLWL